jgi:hypothetical protein
MPEKVVPMSSHSQYLYDNISTTLQLIHWISQVSKDDFKTEQYLNELVTLAMKKID